jgi:hypothetical protein
MISDVYFLLVVAFGLIAIASLVVLALDRAGRERAWREVADVRRDQALGRDGRRLKSRVKPTGKYR